MPECCYEFVNAILALPLLDYYDKLRENGPNRRQRAARRRGGSIYSEFHSRDARREQTIIYIFHNYVVRLVSVGILSTDE